MHPNAQLLERLYTCLAARDGDGMAECYADDATFHDIAFDLKGKHRIHAMWDMVCHAEGFKAKFTVLDADDMHGTAEVVDDYFYHNKSDRSDRRRPVHNVIRSEFQFKSGLIIQHEDTCDPRKWGWQALGLVKGTLTWLFPPLLKSKAKKKLDAFIDEHRVYP